MRVLARGAAVPVGVAAAHGDQHEGLRAAFGEGLRGEVAEAQVALEHLARAAPAPGQAEQTGALAAGGMPHARELPGVAMPYSTSPLTCFDARRAVLVDDVSVRRVRAGLAVGAGEPPPVAAGGPRAPADDAGGGGERRGRAAADQQLAPGDAVLGSAFSPPERAPVGALTTLRSDGQSASGGGPATAGRPSAGPPEWTAQRSAAASWRAISGCHLARPGASRWNRSAKSSSLSFTARSMCR